MLSPRAASKMLRTKAYYIIVSATPLRNPLKINRIVIISESREESIRFPGRLPAREQHLSHKITRQFWTAPVQFNNRHIPSPAPASCPARQTFIVTSALRTRYTSAVAKPQEEYPMKLLTTLLAAVVLLSPAFAQKPTFQGTHPRPKLAIVAPASKPVLLHTGKPITPDQKRQLMLTGTKSSAPRTPAGAMRVQNPVLSTANLLTPDQLYVNGAYIFAQGARVDQFDGILSFPPGPDGFLIFNLTVKANTAYTLLMKVSIDSVTLILPNTPSEITISTSSVSNQGSGVNAPQTFNAPMGENEFAYSFVANSAGNLPITIYSPNAFWSFESAEITSAAF
jgi:hypothetical protein